MINNIDDMTLKNFNKSLVLAGQEIKLLNKENNVLTKTKAIVKAERVQNLDTNFASYVSDIYKIYTLEKTNLDEYVVFKNKKYKIESIDDTTPIYISYCKYNTVANIYLIELLENSTTINKDNIYQIVATCKENNIVVENPTIIYSSSDDAIATVNESGLITGVGEGNTLITCKFKDITTTISVKVNGDTPSEIEYFIDTTGNDFTIKRYNTRVIYGQKIINGMVDKTSNLTFSFTPPTGTTIKSHIGGEEAEIKILNSKGYIEGTYPLILLENEAEVERVDITFIN